MNTSRRNFLRASGVCLALPWLETFANSKTDQDIKRLLLIGIPLGLHKQAFKPKGAGTGSKPSEYLKIIENFRSDYTAITGLDHPGVHGGHAAEDRLFTGLPSSRKNARSLDQYIASRIGHNTRFDSLALSAGSNPYSWTSTGSKIPATQNMGEVFDKLFLDNENTSKKAVLAEIDKGRSILDFVLGQARSLKPKMSASDQNKFDEYLETVRATEKQLEKSESWVHKPKPKVNFQKNFQVHNYADPELGKNLSSVLDITRLAFQTDSTRIITFGYFRQNSVNLYGVKGGYHNLSHHGQNVSNINQLKKVESNFFLELNKLLATLKNTREGNSNMLANTTIIVSSNLGNGNTHSVKDLPALIIGGRFKHQQHLEFSKGAYPLSNLFLSTLHQFGIMDKSFGGSSGPLKGLDLI